MGVRAKVNLLQIITMLLLRSHCAGHRVSCGEGGEEGEGEVGGGQGPAVPRLQVVRGVEVEVLVVQSIHRVQNLDNKQL